MSKRPLGTDPPDPSHDEPGPSRNHMSNAHAHTDSGLLAAPDLQLDCLETDDDDDDDEEEEEEGDNDGNADVVVATMHHGQNAELAFADAITVDSSDTATTSADSGEDGPPTARPRGVWRCGHRTRSASTSDSGLAWKNRRRLDPLGTHSNVFSSNNLYMPHALLLRRQQLQREIHRRSIIPIRENNDLDVPLSYSLARHRILVNNSGAIGSHFNRLLQLVGMRGLNMGLRQDVIEQHTSTSKYAAEDVAEKEEDREKCTICWDNFEVNIEIRTLGCKHLFHTDCVDRWLRNNKQCPMCRLQVDSHNPIATAAGVPTEVPVDGAQPAPVADSQSTSASSPPSSS